MTTTHDLLLEAEERLELTEEGWIEKVVYGPAGNMDHRISVAFGRLGVPEECALKNTRLAPFIGAAGREVAYAPDAMVVLPENPVWWQRGDPDEYQGVPDLVVEILGGRRPQAGSFRTGGNRERRLDLVEKRRNYALRGIPDYWIVEPTTGEVRWLHLVEDDYAEVWTRDLAEVTLPWADRPQDEKTPGRLARRRPGAL